MVSNPRTRLGDAVLIFGVAAITAGMQAAIEMDVVRWEWALAGGVVTVLGVVFRDWFRPSIWTAWGRFWLGVEARMVHPIDLKKRVLYESERGPTTRSSPATISQEQPAAIVESEEGVMLLPRIRLVPAWSVTVVGALIVAVAVALGPLLLYGLEEDVRDERGALDELKELTLQGWTNHTTADGKAVAADTMIVLAEQFGSPPHSFRLGRAGTHLTGAILSMWASTGATDDSELEPRVMELHARLLGGDLTAYVELAEVLDDLRLESAAAINARALQIDASERRIQELERQLDRTRRWQAGMNVAGLVIVLLAELPIWRRRAA